MVHGDDYVTVGSEENVRWLRDELEKVYEIKTSMVGRRQGLKKEVRVLNRIVRWTEAGWERPMCPRATSFSALSTLWTLM